ncbi:hypothetical protein CC86DRAFT_332341 [Ophiobolus disseminans]|uniref:Rhodopsin domain-containing protein n=1 Tax=Ophiobolus disseminans TaxID=1469910 RepID=A0A6A6ZIR5_9PLEO|nr:hypothetical protein CC86DRAFT_332341 [Ophiobolus disseminans]
MSEMGANGDFDTGRSSLHRALLATAPALAPPHGVQSNFEDPPSLAPQFKMAVYILVPIMICHVLLRMYTRLRVKNSLGIDDYVCVIAAVVLVVWCGLVFSTMGNPLGPHQWNVRLIAFTTRFRQIAVVQNLVYSFAATFVKLSILLLYRRLFWVRNTSRYMTWIGIFTITLFYMGSFVSSMVHCMPRHGESWVSQSAKDRCRQPQIQLSVVQGFFGVLSDFYLLLIPMLQISRLRVTTLQKIGLAGVFLTGLLGCICSITLCVYRYRQLGSNDSTYQSVPAYTFTVVELNVGIVCSCMPVVFVVLKNLSKTITSKISGRSSGKTSNPLPGENARPVTGLPQSIPRRPLPIVPKAHLSTIISFVRNGRRNGGLVGTNTTSISDFDPREDSYHAHIQFIQEQEKRHDLRVVTNDCVV